MISLSAAPGGDVYLGSFNFTAMLNTWTVFPLIV